MSWIDIVDEADADGRLAETYDAIADERGKVANIMRVHSLQPEAMRAHMELYTTLMFRQASLSRETCEMIATAVSTANDCDYCRHHHGVALDAYWDDEARLEQFVEDWRSLDDLSERHRAMLDYAESLTDSPDAVEEADLDRLREVGLEDDEILSLNLVASYFNFVNRIAEGLGVEFDDDEMQGYDY
jgi:uncharacterized peroxidase-related enzyme